MLKRLHFGYDSERDLLAIVAGPQKLLAWRTTTGGDSSETYPRAPDLEFSTDRSKVVGMHLQPGGQLITVHEAGAVAAWTISLDDEEGSNAELAWESSLDFIPALTASTSAGGGRIAVAGKLGELVLVEVSEESVDSTLTGHSAEITALCFDADGQRLVTGSRDHTLYLWDLSSLEDDGESEPHASLHGCESWPLSMAFSSDGNRLAAGAMDNGVYLWSLGDEPEMVGCVFEHHGWVVDVEWAPDDSIVAAASWDNTIGIYGRERLRPRFSFAYHRDYVSTLCFHDDHLYSGGYDQRVCHWRWREPDFAGVVEAHSDWILEMVELDGDRIATLSSNSTARIWSLPKFELLATLGTSVSAGFALGASVDMSSFVSGQSDTEDQLEDKRPPRAELPPGKLNAIRKLDASRTSNTAKTAFGMLESQLQGGFEADSAFESELDMDAYESVTAEYDSDADLDPEVAEISGATLSEPDDATAEADLAHDHETPTLEADSGELDESPDEDAAADDASIDLDVELSDAPSLDVDLGDGPSVEIDDQFDVTDPEDVSLNVDSPAPEAEPEETAEDAGEPPADGTDHEEEATAREVAEDDETASDEEDEADDPVEAVEPDAAVDESEAVDAEQEDDAEDMLDVDEDPDGAAEDFVATDFGDTTGDDELGALSSGSLSPGGQGSSIDEELDATPTGRLDLEEPSADSDDGAINDFLDEAPDDLGLGQISSSELSGDLDLDLSDRGDEFSADLDRVDPTDDQESDTGSPAERDESPPADTAKKSPGAPAEANEPAKSPPAAERRSRDTQTKTEGEGDDTEDESDDDEGPLEAPEPEARPNVEPTESEPPAEVAPESKTPEKDDTTTSRASSLKARLKSALEKSKKSSRSQKEKVRADSSSPEPSEETNKSGLSLPKPAPKTGGSDGDETPAAELDSDLGLGDDLADTLSRLMPIGEDGEPVEPDGDAPPLEQPDEPPEAIEPEEDDYASPGSEVEGSSESAEPSDASMDQDAARDDEESLLIDLVDVADEQDELIEPDPDYDSGDTLTAIRPMSLASEAEDTPGLRIPEGSPDDATPEPPSFRDLEDDATPTPSTIRESGNEITPVGEITPPEQVVADEDATKQVDDSDLRFIRSGGDPTSDETAGHEETSVPALDQQTHAGSDGLSSPSVIHSELADLWLSRSTAGVFGKGIIRPSPQPDEPYVPAQKIDTPHRWVYGLARLVERGLICVCGGDDTLSIYSEKGEAIASLKVPENGLNDIAVVALGSVVFAAGDDGYIYAWVLPDDPIAEAKTIDRASVSGHDGWVTSLDVDADRELLLSGSFDGTARLWSLDGSTSPIILDAHEGAVSGVAMTPRGPVTAGHDGTVRFWTDTGLQVDQLDGYKKVLSVEHSGGTIAWTTASGKVFVRDSDGVRSLDRHESQATATAIDENGALATADKKGTLRLYAPNARSPFQELNVGSGVWAMVLTEFQLLVGTDDGGLRIYKRS